MDSSARLLREHRSFAAVSLNAEERARLHPDALDAILKSAREGVFTARPFSSSTTPGSDARMAPTHPAVQSSDVLPLDWAFLSQQSPPQRDWAVDYWLPMAHASLLAGNGGIGKTLLAQILGTCLALDIDYIDTVVKPRRVLFLAGEDEGAELWRRQIAICDWLRRPLTDLTEKFFVESHMDRDMTLAGVAFGNLVQTPLLAELREKVGDFKADYVFIDSVARAFGGSENDRHQVTQFVSWLIAACRPTGAGVCLLAHPARSLGSEFSGSSAWEASVRSRLYLGTKLPDQRGDQGDDDGADENVRFLSRRKANYSALDFRKLIYCNGMLVPENAGGKSVMSARGGEFAKDIVIRTIRKLKDIGVYGMLGARSPDYLPKLAAQYQLLDGLTKQQFARAMHELMLDKRIISDKVGQYSNRNPRYVLVEVHT